MALKATSIQTKPLLSKHTISSRPMVSIAHQRIRSHLSPLSGVTSRKFRVANRTTRR